MELLQQERLGKTFAFLESPSFTTPNIGLATGTSLDLGGTTLFGSRAITVDTGGVLNIDIGSAAGDDFTVDTNKLVVEGDTGNVGIGTTGPQSKFHILTSGSVTGDLDANTEVVITGTRPFDQHESRKLVYCIQ